MNLEFTAKRAAGRGTRIEVRPVDQAAEWDQLLRQAPRPRFQQSWTHGEGLKAEGASVLRLLIADDQPRALCQVHAHRNFGLPVSRVEQGPIFLEESPSCETQLAVLRALRRRWRFGLRGMLVLDAALPECAESHELLRQAGFRRRHTQRPGPALQELRLPLDDNRSYLAADWHAPLWHARRLGMSLRLRRDAAALDWLLDRPADEIYTGVLGDRSAHFYREAFAHEARDFWVLQTLARGEPEAAMLLGRMGQRAAVLLTWAATGQWQQVASRFLLWNAAIEMQRAGCQGLDLDTSSQQLRGVESRGAGEWLAF